MAITMAGTGSGLDLESIIKTFVSAERQPKETRINDKEITLNTELSGVGTLRAAIADFQDITSQLSNLDTFYKSSTDLRYQGKTQSLNAASDPSMLQDSFPISIATKGVVPKGSFNVKVDQLATGSRLESDFYPFRSSKLGAGEINLAAGSQNFTVKIAATDTLQDIQKMINEAPDNFGVSANLISTDVGVKLVYTSEKTGVANNLTATGTTFNLGGISSRMTGEAARDAIIQIDGNMVTKDSNVFDKAVTGVVITANSLTEGLDTVNFSTATDLPAIEDLVKQFVDGYNSLIDQINVLTHPETGTLKSDAAARNIKQQLQTITGGVVSGTTGRLNTLYSAGISLEEGGLLAISPFGKNGSPSGAARLNDAINNSLGDLGKLFAGTGGVASRIDDVLVGNLDSKGIITQRQQMINGSLKQLETDRDKLDTYISSFEDTLRQKYTALDTTVTRYNATRDYLSAQLGG